MTEDKKKNVDAEEPEVAGAEPEPEEAAEAEGTEEAAGADAGADAQAESDRYLRLMAEFQNYKRRTEKERETTFAYATEKLVTELLTVLDNFQRGLESECADEKYAQGMEMICGQFLEVLTKAGLSEIEAQGTEFDPNFHNAVMTEDNPDFESGQVTEVLQKGYKLNDKVIRPSMVKVNN